MKTQNIGGTTGHGQAYHSYWPLDFDKLNAEFGTAADLLALSNALHARGMLLMVRSSYLRSSSRRRALSLDGQVDIVVNHVGATSSSTFEPGPAYGHLSKKTDYHPFCWIDPAYTNQTNIEQCWLGDSTVALVDVRLFLFFVSILDLL